MNFVRLYIDKNRGTKVSKNRLMLFVDSVLTLFYNALKTYKCYPPLSDIKLYFSI